MGDRYKLLGHDIFLRNLEEFQRIAKKEHLRSLKTQFEKCRIDPSRVGKPLKLGGVSLFDGTVCRLQVGGPKWYRFIYWVDTRNKVVLGIYLSTVPRSKLDYSKIDWKGIAAQICEDYVKERYAHFTVLE